MDEGRLFPVEHVGHSVRHPDLVLIICDQLSDEGKQEEAHELLDASERFVTLLDKYTPDDAA